MVLTIWASRRTDTLVWLRDRSSLTESAGISFAILLTANYSKAILFDLAIENQLGSVLVALAANKRK